MSTTSKKDDGLMAWHDSSALRQVMSFLAQRRKNGFGVVLAMLLGDLAKKMTISEKHVALGQSCLLWLA